MRKMQIKSKIVLFTVFLFPSCGIPNDTVVLDPPNIGDRIDLSRLVATFQNQNSDGQFYPSELKGFNFYYRFFNPNSSSDKAYIPTGSSLNGDLIDTLTSLGESNLTLSTINSLASTDNKQQGYNGFFKFFSKSESTAGSISLQIDSLNLNKKIIINFNFNITDGLKTPYIEYDAYISASETEQRKVYLYRNINSVNEVSTLRFRTFDESANGYITTNRYSFLPSDVDLKGNNSTSDKSNTHYYVGVWCVAQGVTQELQNIVSTPLFLGMRDININYSSVDEDNVSFGTEEAYLRNFQ